LRPRAPLVSSATRDRRRDSRGRQGALFLITYSLALADPVPHRIDGAMVGDPAANESAVEAVERVARGALHFRQYPSARRRCARSIASRSTRPST
jgi:hypothetical protein